MAPDPTVTLFSLVFICTPLLYIGLRMVMDPASLDRLARRFTGAMREFEGRLPGFVSRRRLGEPDPVCITRQGKNKVRLAGVLIAAFAFAALAGIVR